MGSGCQFPSFLQRKCFLYLVSSRGRSVKGWEEQKIIQKKEFTDHKVSIPGFNLTFVFLILSIVWAKLTPITEISDSATLCADSSTFRWYHTDKNKQTNKPTTKVPNDSRSQLFLVITQRTAQFIFIQMMRKTCLIGNRCTSLFGGSGRYGQGNHTRETRSSFWKCT